MPAAMAPSAFPMGGISGALLTEVPAEGRDRTGSRANLQGCTPEGERKDIGETLHGKSWFHIKLKSKSFL